MKRTKLIEYTLIVIAAIFGYKFFEGIFGLIVQMITGLTLGTVDLGELFVPLALICGGYLLLFVVLVRKSREIAIYLNGNNAEETINLRIGKKALLHLIIIGVCLITILDILPDALIFLYESLKTKNEYDNPVSDSLGFSFERSVFITKIVRLLMAVVVLVTSKEIAQWFLKNDGKDELILEAESKDETPNN